MPQAAGAGTLSAEAGLPCMSTFDVLVKQEGVDRGVNRGESWGPKGTGKGKRYTQMGVRPSMKACCDGCQEDMEAALELSVFEQARVSPHPN